MNRTIKFRAWDTAQQRLVSPAYLMPPEFASEHWVFEQFTGLLDKNGVEIYDGDILRKPQRPYSIYPKHGNAYRTVAWAENGINQCGWNIANGSTWEVIGNIHENPSLLETLSPATENRPNSI